MALCSRCRHTLLHRLHPSSSTSLRYLSMALSTANAPPTAPPPFTQSSQPQAAVSSANPGTSQPFSAPQFAPASVTKANKPPRKGPRVPSKISGGGELRGIGYTKAQPTVLAKEDDEYPQWLWGLLDQPKADGSEVSKVDVAGNIPRHQSCMDC
jgi:large subunit ribosomal protein L54